MFTKLLFVGGTFDLSPLTTEPDPAARVRILLQLYPLIVKFMLLNINGPILWPLRSWSCVRCSRQKWIQLWNRPLRTIRSGSILIRLAVTTGLWIWQWKRPHLLAESAEAIPLFTKSYISRRTYICCAYTQCRCCASAVETLTLICDVFFHTTTFNTVCTQHLRSVYAHYELMLTAGPDKRNSDWDL